MKQKKGMELVTERTVDGFRRELLRREYSHGTAESYVRSIRAFARWSGGAVDRGLVLTWKARLTARYAPATVNAMLAGLNRFFDFAGRPECRVKVLRLQRCSFREAERELDRGEYRALVRTARTLGRERLALGVWCWLMAAAGWAWALIRMPRTVRLARMVLLLPVEGRAELRVGWKMAALPCGSRAERLFRFNQF